MKLILTLIYYTNLISRILIIETGGCECEILLEPIIQELHPFRSAFVIV